MNFVGHILLAGRHLSAGHWAAGPLSDGQRADPEGEQAGQGPDAETGFLIGSALPDFASMGRFRLTETANEPSVRAGVDFHHQTDDLFHSHPWFRDNSNRVEADLEAAGIPRGAAMACGHVGVELLLDGRLLEENDGLRASVEGATDSLAQPDFGLTDLVDQDRGADWTDHLARIRDWPLPQDYRSPDGVAGRLERILSRRPRLAFDRAQRHVVASVLARNQQTLEAGADELIDDLSRLLATPAKPEGGI